MADNDNSGPKHVVTESYGEYKGRKEKKELKRAIGIPVAIILLLFFAPLAAYAIYGGVQSGKFAEWGASAQAQLAENRIWQTYRGALGSAESAFDFGAKSRTNVSTTGFVLKDFNLVSSAKEIPHGSSLVFGFEYEMENYDEPLDVLFTCYTGEADQGEEIVYGEILPSDSSTGLTTINPNIHQEIRCQFTEEQMQALEYTTSRLFHADTTFGFETKDVTFDLYLSDPNYLNDLQPGEDFFEYWSLDVDLPIRTVYNGEPLKIELAPGDEDNQPVIVSDDMAYQTFPILVIDLENEWSGTVEKLNYVNIMFPDGIRIDPSTTLSLTCPFTLTGSYNDASGDYSVYSIPLDYIDEIGFEEGLAIETEKNFECWLEIDTSIIPSGDSKTKVQFYADAGYKYNSGEQATSVKYREVVNEE